MTSINYTKNFINVCTNTLSRAMAAKTDLERMAALDRQTLAGLNWAIDFARNLNREIMTDAELKHAIRLTYYRGNACPGFNA